MTKIFRICLLVWILALNGVLISYAQNLGNEPILTSIDFERLKFLKSCYTQKSSQTIRNAVSKLVKQADQALQQGSFSVTHKTITPVSGSKNDYLSLGPYWWPDPNEADGLPWIRKDGEINPMTRGENVDEPRKGKFFRNVEILGLAFFFTEDEKYSRKAVELIETWFMKSETRMNPNLDFAQGIPGKNNGRGIGIIEFSGVSNILTTIELLTMFQALENGTKKSVDQWMSDYVEWLQTSENGIFERNTKNNHATHYDKQLVSILLYLGRDQEAKAILEEVKTKRIATQIEKNGKQPHELKRTKALSYSVMNLEGFTQLAWYGKCLGVDLLNYRPDNAGGIKEAYKFLYPYAFEDKKWEYEQIQGLEKSKKSLKKLFVKAAGIFNLEDYCELTGSEVNFSDLDMVIYACEEHLDCLN